MSVPLVATNIRIGGPPPSSGDVPSTYINHSTRAVAVPAFEYLPGGTFDQSFHFVEADSDYALIGTYSVGTPVADYPVGGLNLVISQCIFYKNFMGLTQSTLNRYVYSDNFSESDAIHRGFVLSSLTQRGGGFTLDPDDSETFWSYVASITGTKPGGFASHNLSLEILQGKRFLPYGEDNSLRDYDDWLRRVSLIKMGPRKAPKGKESQGSLKLVNSIFYRNGNLFWRGGKRGPHHYRVPFYLLCLPKVGPYGLGGGFPVNDKREAGNIEVVIANNVFYDNAYYSETKGGKHALKHLSSYGLSW